jgi:SAM-dependent methyltransferase
MKKVLSFMHLFYGASLRMQQNPGCFVCGRRMPLLQLNVISEKLAREWELDEKWLGFFQEREGLFCTGCGSALRSVFLASAMLGFSKKILGIQSGTFRALVADRKFQQLKIAELNSLGALHRFLKNSPNLSYSEYGSKNPDVRSEDLMCLSYEDNSFDWVLHSETLEHVPDFQSAWGEIYRVLKPGGVCIFTIPIVLDGRKSRKRARLVDGVVIHHLPASYHGLVGEEKSDYLVFYEFGEDCLDEVKKIGFEISMVQDGRNPALSCFFAQKTLGQAK